MQLCTKKYHQEKSTLLNYKTKRTYVMCDNLNTFYLMRVISFSAFKIDNKYDATKRRNINDLI